MPDNRSLNKTYSKVDIILGCFGLFYTQSTSFLNYKNILKNETFLINLKRIFSIEKIPSDNQIRNFLDKINYNFFIPIFRKTFELLPNKLINSYRGINDNLLIAIDGTGYYSSSEINCKNCLKRKYNESLHYQHHALMAGIVSLDEKPYIPLAPEFIKPQRTHDKQDCELVAAKRWVEHHGKQYSDYNTTILGDGLYSNIPFISKLLKYNLSYILTAKESNNKSLYISLNDSLYCENVSKKVVHKSGIIYYYSFVNGAYMNSYIDKNNIKTNWCEVTFNNKGKSYRFAFITNHHITHKNVEEIIKAGRARWKLENQNNNILKNNGYNLEHNYGHGKENLSMNLLLLNLFSFLFHTVLMLGKNSKLKQLKDKYGARYNLFNLIKGALAWIKALSFEDVLSKMLSMQRCSLAEP